MKLLIPAFISAILTVAATYQAQDNSRTPFDRGWLVFWICIMLVFFNFFFGTVVKQIMKQ